MRHYKYLTVTKLDTYSWFEFLCDSFNERKQQSWKETPKAIKGYFAMQPINVAQAL